MDEDPPWGDDGDTLVQSEFGDGEDDLGRAAEELAARATRLAKRIVSRIPLHEVVFLDRRLSHGAVMVYLSLLRHAGRSSQTCFPSHTTIGLDTGLKRRQVFDHLQQLKDCGYVDWEPRGTGQGGKSNLYTILPVEDSERGPVREIAQVDDPTCAENCTPPVRKTAHERSTGNKKKISARPKSDAASLNLAEQLRQCILGHKPDAKVPGSLEEWANTFRLMRERDGRTHERIVAVIRWATADQFWKSNILSAAKLREKFDTLEAQMRRGAPPVIPPAHERPFVY